MATCVYCRQLCSKYFKMTIDIILNDTCKSESNNIFICAKCYYKDDLSEILQGVLVEIIMALTYKKNIRHLLTPDPETYYKTDPHINYSIIYVNGFKIHHSHIDLQYTGQSFRLYKVAYEMIAHLHTQFHDYV